VKTNRAMPRAANLLRAGSLTTYGFPDARHEAMRERPGPDAPRANLTRNPPQVSSMLLRMAARFINRRGRFSLIGHVLIGPRSCNGHPYYN